MGKSEVFGDFQTSGRSHLTSPVDFRTATKVLAKQDNQKQEDGPNGCSGSFQQRGLGLRRHQQPENSNKREAAPYVTFCEMSEDHHLYAQRM